MAALRDDDDLVRFNAALALAYVDPATTDGVPVLVAALEDGNDETQAIAAEALERIGSDEARAAAARYRRAHAGVR